MHVFGYFWTWSLFPPLKNHAHGLSILYQDDYAILSQIGHVNICLCIQIDLLYLLTYCVTRFFSAKYFVDGSYSSEPFTCVVEKPPRVYGEIVHGKCLPPPLLAMPSWPCRNAMISRASTLQQGCIRLRLLQNEICLMNSSVRRPYVTRDNCPSWPRMSTVSVSSPTLTHTLFGKSNTYFGCPRQPELTSQCYDHVRAT